jgi:putative MFS transporter
MLAIVLALEVTPIVGSWRIVFFLSTIPGLYALLARLPIPESPKWLASVGRLDEAKQIVHAIEKAHGVGTNDPDRYSMAEVPQTFEKTANVHGKNSADVAMAAADNVFLYRDLTQWQRLRLLFRGEYLKRSMVLWFLWTGLSYAYFAIYVWLPILVKGDDHDINRSTLSMLVIVASQLPGYAAAAYLVEVIGRRFGLAFFLIGSFASTILFSYIAPTQVNLMIAGCFMSFFMLGAWGALYAYTPENYPTSIRAMGSAYPAGISRLGAIGGTLIVPILFDDGRGWSVAAIMWMNSAVLIACVVVLLLFGYETRGKDIDEAIPSLMDHSGIGAMHTQTTMDDDDSMMIMEEEHRRSKLPRIPPSSTSDSIVPAMHIHEQHHDHMMMSPSSAFIVDDDVPLHYHKELPTIVPRRTMEVPPRNFRGNQLISLI